MRIIRHLERCGLSLRSPVVTLGNFDGVHVAHREILRRVVTQARERGGESVVITFFPHPAAVLASEKASPAIASLRERLAVFRELGVETVVLQHFTTRFSQITAEQFIERYLVARLGAVKVIIGHSVSFGHGRQGNAHLLTEAGTRLGFQVEVVGPIAVDGVPVSSTMVRRCVTEGRILLAAKLLGRPYSIAGRVVAGDHRGKGLGYPTANVKPRVPFLAPDGVYAVRVECRGRLIPGVANIGRNPTFGEGRPRGIEAHLFDFHEELYGSWIRVLLIERLRGEERFRSARDLVDQIQRDVARAKEILTRT